MPDMNRNDQHDHSINGLSRIRKKPGRLRRLRRTFLRTCPEPRDFRQTANTAATIDLAWSNALGSLAGKQTRIEYRNPATANLWTWSTPIDVATSVETQQVTGLDADTTFEFRITHFDSVGRSKFNIIRAATLAA